MILWNNTSVYFLTMYNDTSRPLNEPQEYLIHFGDFLLPCNIPTQIIKPLTVIKHLVSSPFGDKNKSYYTALAKQSHSYNELHFIDMHSAKFISWYKLNKKHIINHLLLNILRLSEILLKNFHQFLVIVLFEIQQIYWTRTNDTPLTLSSLLSHIWYIAMTEHTNSCNHLT